jgi:hypothetical protein
VALDRWPAWVRLALALAFAVAASLLVDGDESGWLEFLALLPTIVLVASVVGTERGSGGLAILLVMVAAVAIGLLAGRVAALVVLGLLPLAGWLLVDRPDRRQPA